MSHHSASQSDVENVPAEFASLLKHLLVPLSDHPDLGEATVWARRFFSEANTMRTQQCDERLLVGYLDAAYAKVAEHFPHDTAQWPDWAGECLPLAAHRHHVLRNLQMTVASAPPRLRHRADDHAPPPVTTQLACAASPNSLSTTRSRAQDSAGSQVLAASAASDRQGDPVKITSLASGDAPGAPMRTVGPSSSRVASEGPSGNVDGGFVGWGTMRSPFVLAEMALQPGEPIVLEDDPSDMHITQDEEVEILQRRIVVLSERIARAQMRASLRGQARTTSRGRSESL